MIIIINATGCGGSAPGPDEAVGQTHEATYAPTGTAAPSAANILTETAAPVETSISFTPTSPASSPSPTATPANEATRTPEREPPTPPAGPLSGEELVSGLRRGGYVIYFRHAATDPIPDDANPVDFSDCGTQRNLSEEGREQALAMGQAIERLEIPIGRVLASPFCRTLETAQLAFGKATSEPGLENLETSENEAERERRIGALRGLLAIRPEGAANTILVGHGFNINAAAGITIAEGEAAIFRPEGEDGFTLVAMVKPGGWEDWMQPE